MEDSRVRDYQAIEHDGKFNLVFETVASRWVAKAGLELLVPACPCQALPIASLFI